jgi:hypothetical protein
MDELRTVTIEFFQQEGWSYVTVEDQPELKFVYQGQTGNWMCVVRLQEADHQWLFFSVSPLDAREETRAATMEYLTRANYGMTIGNFEMDLDDGEVRFKTSLDVRGDRLSPALVKQQVYANVNAMDFYLTGLLEVIEGRATPLEAIAAIEG